jgi:muconolactone delta-isomerase
MKFLVLWSVELSLLSDAMVRAIGRMPEYGARMEREGKVEARYHVVGAHGGAWIYDVGSHEEFERLLAMAPVFNFARYTVHPLADMSGPNLAVADGGGRREHAEGGTQQTESRA